MFARTERLLLRPGWPEDAPALHQAIADEAIVKNLGTAPWPYALSDAVHSLDMVRQTLHPSFLIFLRTAGAPQLVGSTGFGPKQGNELEIGYWIARDYWGRGYATEAGRAVLDIAKAIGHRRIQAEHFVDNPASGKVLRKLGFKPTGRVEPRFSKGRNGKADAIHFELKLGESDADGGVMRPLAA